jgi:diguanylate cyclase (GGDEF)-like protein
VVEPETGKYREFSATANYAESLKQAKEGADFFTTVRKAARIFNYPEDLKRFLSAFTKKNIMAEIKRSGIFTLVYRLIMDEKPVYVQLKAAMVEEKEGPRLIVGIYDIDAQVRQEEEFGKQLAQAQTQATIDALTGIKNKHAFLAAQEQMDRQIAEHNQAPFAIVILDVNDLKKVNDTVGHQAGDQYLRDACKIICETFKRSPVFRMGGDEFAVIAQGNDYEHIEELLESVNDRNAEAARTGGIVIACGMSQFDNDACVATVFDRADHNMYENKRKLKRE